MFIICFTGKYTVGNKLATYYLSSSWPEIMQQFIKWAWLCVLFPTSLNEQYIYKATTIDAFIPLEVQQTWMLAT